MLVQTRLYVFYLLLSEQSLQIINPLKSMKNEPQQQETQFINHAKCSKGNQATMVCSSQHCTSKAFICINKNCECRSNHKFCFHLTIQGVLDAIQANCFSLEPISLKIEEFYNQVIDKLSDQRDKILLEIKQSDKFSYFGLTELQTKILNAVKNGIEFDSINCKCIWTIQNQFKGQKTINQTFNQVEKLLIKMKQNFEKQSESQTKKLREFLQKIKSEQSLQNIFENSQIIKNTEDQQKLVAFFTEKKVKSAKLLYRASQNQFLTTKWYDKCGNIANTLTIAETQFGKVIGGFTSFKWIRNSQWISAVNDQKNHFLFSLTNNDKLSITKNAQYSIHCYTNNDDGPAFGGHHDLSICNKANQNTSYANVGYTYTNPNYVYNEPNSQVKFSGKGSFKIKQWEVWEIKFFQ